MEFKRECFRILAVVCNIQCVLSNKETKNLNEDAYLANYGSILKLRLHTYTRIFIYFIDNKQTKTINM